MRLNPPLAISAIVTVAIAAITIANFNRDCAFTPDGKPRYAYEILSFGAWLLNPSKCDLWSGIATQKPIETIQLNERSDGGSSIIAEVSPDGTGHVIVLPPLRWPHPLYAIKDPSVTDYARFGHVFPIQNSMQLYSEVRELVGPVRDFQGGWNLHVTNPEARQANEIDHPRTRKIVCRHLSEQIPPSHGPQIGFKFAKPRRSVWVDTGVNCHDLAQTQIKARVLRSINAMISATGERKAINALRYRDYPFCSEPREPEPCVTPIL